MPATFAVIDLGSNAIRLQLASVDEPGTYKVIQQERRPVRLGRNVFETGALDPKSREEGLDTLQQFRALAERQEVASIRAVATSALREASDGPSFVEEARTKGVPLEILSEEDEARLIVFGIRTGLKFDPAAGLFMDIGGGSVEIALGDRSHMSYLHSLPLGAVRLTERFLKHDPPNDRELADLEDFALEKLAPVTRRIAREKFSMAFGSGGTMTTLADIDARLSGETQGESLYVLRRTRLSSLFELLRSQNLEQRTAAIASDPKRAEILIAGTCVLLAMMKNLELDQILVSRRGLRDGLMVDLITRNFPAYAGPWVEDVL